MRFALAAVLLQSLAAPAQTDAKGTAELRGRLIDTQSGQPIVGAIVRLSIVATPPVPPTPPRSVESDDTGRFAFTSLTAGQYNISVVKGGVVTTLFGAPEG